ncbi:hypothetical protein ACIPEN_17300 [Herbaspirillum chlorophenolicum]|uniref:Uncharacterized protein n=1 Tax=Herbaspirillum chlorophenolicum TaxID=211589 RepID=A0ABW8F2R3_9BURK
MANIIFLHHCRTQHNRCAAFTGHCRTLKILVCAFDITRVAASPSSLNQVSQYPASFPLRDTDSVLSWNSSSPFHNQVPNTGTGIATSRAGHAFSLRNGARRSSSGCIHSQCQCMFPRVKKTFDRGTDGCYLDRTPKPIQLAGQPIHTGLSEP